MRTLLVLLCVFLACVLPVQAGQRFAAVAFHDVVEFRGDLDDDAVTVDRLIAFFEWLRANRWTAVSLDDVDAARHGKKPLPERAILLTFDDGYRSVYTRVFPLALAYRMPVVIALVGEWLDAPMDAQVRYGKRDVPRAKFLSWDELREMSRTGLVEIASHSYALHRGVLGNPQGNELAAAANRRYTPGRGYESEAAYRRRITDDLQKSRELLRTQLGQAPRTLVWPFGRYSGEAMKAAREVGFEFALTLDPEPADVSTPMALARNLPTNDLDLATMVSNLRFEDRLPAAQRFVELNPADVWAGDAAGTDARLGTIIERLRTLGATSIVLDAAEIGADGRVTATWFPSSQLPVRADVLSRVAWQCQSRAGVSAFVRLPASAALRTLGDRGKVIELFHDLGSYVPANGLFVEDAPELVRTGAVRNPAAAPWETRAARDAVQTDSLSAADALELHAFHAVEYSRPGLHLALLADAASPAGPAAIADLTLFPVALDSHAVKIFAERMQSAGWLASGIARRSGLWFTGKRPPGARDLIGATRIFQSHGGTAIGWAADDPIRDRPAAKTIAPTVSASRFPVKF
jgi:peptidoglycan/xylan/chitin deacetylase (PgdA/CDA1 family)